MKPTVLTPLSAICWVRMVAMCESFCGILNAHARLASIGSTMDDDAASVIIGVSDSAATSSIAKALGVVFGPTITSTISSAVSLRALRTALVGSDASSRITYWTFCPAISFGHSSIAFFDGIPIAAAGPVVEIVTPTLICAYADKEKAAIGMQEKPTNRRSERNC